MSEPSPIILSSPDAGSRGAGGAIRRARESQGMTLEALAAMIKVTPAKLEALELGRYDLLPDANFTRALAMTVCRALKLDPGEVLAALPAARPASLAEGKPPLNQPFKEAKGGSPLFDRHALDLKGLLTPRFLAPVVLLIGALVIYALPDSVDLPDWLTPSASSSQPASASPEAATPGSASPSAVVTQQVPVPAASPDAASAVVVAVPSLKLDVAESASAVAPTVQAPAVAGAQQQAIAPLAAPGTLQPAPTLSTPSATPPVPASNAALVIQLTSPSWVEVRDGQGQRLFGRLAQAGENIALDGVPPLQVRLGYVAGVQLRFKGQPVDLSSFSRNNVARLELK